MYIIKEELRMNAILTPPAVSRNTKRKSLSEKPSKSRIVLRVCNCYSKEILQFVHPNKQQVAIILGITEDDLEAKAIHAMFTSRPQVVACYESQDVAESKLAKLRQATPFIKHACHQFHIVEE